MRMKKKVAFILAILYLICMLAVFSSAAQITDSGSCGEKMSWTLDSDGILTISGIGKIEKTSWLDSHYANEIKSVIINNGMTKLTTDWIPSYVKEISIPATVTKIPELFTTLNYLERITVNSQNAFFRSDNNGILFDKSMTTLFRVPIACELSDFIIPDSVSTVHGSAFYNCKNLKTLTIGQNVTIDTDQPDGINFNTFNLCTCPQLERIIVNENNPFYSNDASGVLFDKNKSLLIVYPRGNQQSSYTVPEGVSIITNRAFHEHEYIKHISLPSSLERIGWGAFTFSNLEEVFIPKNVNSIYAYAFAECKNMTRLTVDPENACFSNDAVGALFDKFKTEILQYPSASPYSIYSIPDTVKRIGSEVFISSKNIRGIIVPASMQDGRYIGGCNFLMCPNLSAVYYEDDTPSVVDSLRKHLNKASLEDTVIYTNFDISSIASGDVNFDGEITVADARLTLRKSVNLDSFIDKQINIADVDKSGEITTADARIILRVVVGLETIE